MQNSIQNLREKIEQAQRYLDKGEIDLCYNLCQNIEKEIIAIKTNESSKESTLIFKNQKKEIMQRLNKLMINSIRNQ